ncbi:hypothetical protein HOY80DRAFT_867812, partial [Tuber brumale]
VVGTHLDNVGSTTTGPDSTSKGVTILVALRTLENARSPPKSTPELRLYVSEEGGFLRSRTIFSN